MNSFVSYRTARHWGQPATGQDVPDRRAKLRHDRRAHPRTAISFPLEFSVLPWFRHWLLRPSYRTIRSLDRNPSGSLAVPDPEPWVHPYLPLVKYLGKLLFINGARCWEEEGRIVSANGLDLSQGGLRMATSYPLWLGASLHLRVPSSEVAPFGYTVLGRVMRVAHMDRKEMDVGVAFTGIHLSDSHELVRFLLTPLPKLAALRRKARHLSRPRTGEPVKTAAPTL